MSMRSRRGPDNFLHIDVPPVAQEKLISQINSESSTDVRNRVLTARLQQKKRFEKFHIKMNGEMTPKHIRNLCTLTDDANLLLKQAISNLSLSARSYFKIIKVAQTIADLEQKNNIEAPHIAEALQYRVKEESQF